MKYNQENISKIAKQLVPISDDEISELNNLLIGVHNAVELMAKLVQPFDKEIDVLKMSSTVDGDKND